MFRLLKALFFTAGPKYSWKRAMAVIAGSTSVIFLLAAATILAMTGTQKFQSRKNAGTIQAIVQTGTQSDSHTGLKFAPLSISYLSEVLDLSVDSPIKLSELNLNVAHERLFATHVIEKVRLKKMKPNLLFIDYSLREPWAFLEDYANTALDSSGFCFPFQPFYTPRKLPQIYLGEEAPPNPWGAMMAQEMMALAHQLQEGLIGEEIARIDLSQVHSSSAGKREIVITLAIGTILRLHPKNCVQQLAHYSILKRRLFNEGPQRMIIDLRIPEVAYIQNSKDAG